MERITQIEYCKSCKNYKLDLVKGIVCKITNNLPVFENECKDFSPEGVTQEQIQAEEPIIINTKQWKCSNCNELIDDSFDTCWNCQKARDESDEIIQTEQHAPTKEEIYQEKKKEGNLIRERFFDSILFLLVIYTFANMSHSFFGWPGELFFISLSYGASVLFPLLMFNIFYVLKIFVGYVKEVRQKEGIKLWLPAIAVNALVILLYVIGNGTF